MTKRSLLVVFLLIVALSVVACGIDKDLHKAKVLEVTDGDTIEVRFTDGQTDKVRYIGMDTPEVYGGEECFGPEASKFNKELVGDRTVWLEFDV